MKQLLGRYLILFLVALVGIMPAVQADQQAINRGATAGDGTGETLYSAFGKVNANDAELYGAKTELVANASALPVTGVAGRLYVTIDNGTQYRWTGSTYLALTLPAVRNANSDVIGLLDMVSAKTIGIGASIPKLQMTTVVIGNSIAAQGKYSGTYWNNASEIHQANDLSGAPLRWKRMTATTRMDLFGVYGYSGQTLPTILADLEGQVWSMLRTSAVAPDCIVGLALLENDIAGGATFVNMQKSLAQFIRDAHGRYPGAVLLLATPRVSFSYNTPDKVLAYQQIRDHMLSLDNGHSIFVARVDGYENPASPGTPLGTSGSPIFTDSSVHPNTKGAIVNARPIAATLQRISREWKTGYAVNSTNMPLGGTSAASGTNVSGTVPTGAAISGSANVTSYVATAEQPGFLVAVTVPASVGPNPVDISSFNFGTLAISGAAQISPSIEVEIVSGAENLHAVEIMPRINNGTTNDFQYYIQNQTGNAQPDWQNGDVLTIRTPPLIVSSGVITACTLYGRVMMKYQGGTTTFRVKSQGIGTVQ